jgi:NAD(P)H-flavin reductase
VFIAGGVGINPLMAILSHLTQLPEAGFEVVFVYSFRLENGKDAAEVLFLQRLRRIFEEGKVRGRLHLFVTSGGEDGHGNGFKGEGVTIRKRRVGKEDVLEMLGPLEERRETVCYICGVPTMTDEFVQVAQEAEGMDLQRVLFERWW